MGNYITDQRKARIDFLCRESESFQTWKDFEAFAFEFLFRECGLTIEKIENDYLLGLKQICTRDGVYTSREMHPAEAPQVEEQFSRDQE
jgi:hypothetical protein